jgi:hypothetical protein
MEALKQMSKRVDKNASGRESDQELLKWNHLVYTKMTPLSVITQKNVQIFNSQSINYDNTSSSIDFVFQSGSNLVGPGSCIEFELSVFATTGATFDFAEGSAMNLFRDAILMSRQGDEVDRCNHVNVYEANKSLLRPKSWFDTTGSLMGYDATTLAVSTNQNVTKHFFSIPLEHILPIFNTGRLIPSQLMSGSRLQLNLEKDEKRLFKFNAKSTGVTWKIENVRMSLSLSMPNDATQTILRDNAGGNALDFQFASVYTQKTKQPESISEQISKSVGRALKLYVVPLNDPFVDPTADPQVPTNAKLFMTPRDVGYTDAQVRAGSLYLPQYRLNDNQIYHYSLQACNKFGQSVRFNKADSKAKGNIFLTDLESHHLIRYSGQSLNNSRVLYCETAYTDTDPKETFLFLEYAREVRIYVNSVAVDS